MIAAFGAALAGADIDDAGRTGPERQDTPGIVGDDAHVHHEDAVLVENPQQGEAVDDQLCGAVYRTRVFRHSGIIHAAE